jgi:hypothetical protein
MIRIEPAPKVVGEHRLWRCARKPSDENYVFNHEVSGSQDVTDPHHSPQFKHIAKDIVAMSFFFVIVTEMQTTIYMLILLLGITAYASAVYQMLKNEYTPSFFSRGVWFLLGINSFAGVLLGEGSDASIILAGTLFAGNTAVFIASYWKGSREFGTAEKISLMLLIISGMLWAVLNAPYIGLIVSLVAHFVGGIPTIWRVIKRPETEQAYHWYFFFVASIISIFASEQKALHIILFPVYFALFDGLIILLTNRKRFLQY